MVHRGRPLISFRFKYNTRKVLSFILKNNEGSTQSGPPYLSEYPYQVSNFSICPVACRLVMYKFFGYVNDV